MKYAVILILVPFILLANVGGIWKREAVNGTPYFSAESGIAVEKQILDLEFYEEKNRVKCRFRSEYHLTSDTSIPKEIIGTFYGIDSRDEVVTFNGESVGYSGSSEALAYLDSAMEMNFVLPEKQTPNAQRFNDLPYEEQRKTIDNRRASLAAQLENIPTLKDSVEYVRKLYQVYLRHDFTQRETICKTPFQITVMPEQQNILIITGILEPQYDELWGMALFFETLFMRHPFLNYKNVGNFRASIAYLLRPLEKWENVGDIEYRVTYPKRMELYSSLFSGKNETYGKKNHNAVQSNHRPVKRDLDKEAWDRDSRLVDEYQRSQPYHFEQSFSYETPDYDSNKPPLKSETETEIIYTGVFNSGFPDRVDFSIFDIPRNFHIGGPKIGFGKNHKNSAFTMRYGWEFGLKIGYPDLLFSLDYDTDYSGYNVLAFSSDMYVPFIFNVGAGIGVPVNINRKKAGIRFNVGTHFLLLGFNTSFDYYPTDNDNLIVTLMGQITF